MYEEALKEVGLSANESKVFLALLELGISNVGSISKESKVHRTNVYDCLSKLESKNLVKMHDKEGTKYFEANDPNELVNIIKEKEKRLKSFIPLLMIDYKLAEKKANTHVFEGVKAIQDILDGFLNYNEPILVYGVPKIAPQILGDWLLPHHKRRVEKKILMLHIYNEDSKERINFLNKMEYTEAKYLPKEFNSPVSTEICGDEIMFVFWKNPPIVIHIKNKEIASFYKSYFGMLWELAQK